MSAAYLALCDIGGMMGVYAGFSMITFAGVFFYGALVCCWLLKKKKKQAENPDQSKAGKSAAKKPSKGIDGQKKETKCEA